ncbi:MAG: hypothetical protein ACYCV6_01135 [Steroidobacteraceae bacterium]
MYQKLSDAVIEATCRELLQVQRRVTVRRVSEELRRRHHASGKNARVARILREVTERMAVPTYEGTPDAEIARLRTALQRAEHQVAEAIARAELSEERERTHQDLWARRFAERMDESERRVDAAIRRHERKSAEQQLRLYRRIAELERENARLAQGRAGHHNVGQIDNTP